MGKKKNEVLLKGDRLYLSRLLEEHAPSMTTWFNDPKVYDKIRDMKFQTTEKIERQWIEQCHQDTTHELLSIYYLPEDRLIGYGGFKHINLEDRSAELWIVIGEKEFWGKGLGQEGRWLICRYGFEVLNFQNILGEHFAINPISFHNALKTGAKHMGTRRKAKWIQGQFVDIHYTDMLREDLVKPQSL